MKSAVHMIVYKYVFTEGGVIFLECCSCNDKNGDQLPVKQKGL